MMNLVRLTAWCIGVVLLVVFAAVRGQHQQAALPDADSILVFPLDQELRLGLEPGEEAVRVTTWLVEPRTAWEGDSRVEKRWCLDLELHEVGEAAPRQWRAWVDSRTSAQEDPDGILRPRSALPDPTLTVTLGRPLYVDLRGMVPRGGTLAIRGACALPGRRLLAIAHGLDRRAWASRKRIEAGSKRLEAERLAASTGASSWEELPASWRSALALNEWKRMGALPGEAGVDVPTARLYQRDGQGGLRDQSARGSLVPPGGALAWNVVGPVRVWGDWSDPSGVRSLAAASFTAIGVDGTVEALGNIRGSSFGPWTLDAGVVSIQVSLRSSEPARVRFYAQRVDADPSWGDPARLAIDDSTYRISPDFRTVELVRVGDEPVDFLMEDVAAARVSFRVPAPPAALLDPLIPLPPTEATLEALNAVDEVVEQWTVKLYPQVSPFERYSMVDTPETAAVAGARSVIFVPSKGQVRLRVRAVVPLDVGVRTSKFEWSEPIGRREYALPEFAPVNAVWVPHEQDPWVALSPERYEALASAGQIIRVDGQVRLEPFGYGSEDGAAAAHEAAEAAAGVKREWHPYTLPGAHDLLAVRSVRGEVRNPLTELGAQPRNVDVPPSGRLPLSYRVSEALVGESLTVTLGDTSFAHVIQAAADILQIGPFPPGRTQAKVDLSGLFLAPQQGGAWRLRRVWPVERGRSLSVPLPFGTSAVSFRAWSARGDTLGLRWRVVPGTHRDPGLFGRLTPLSGSIPLTQGDEAAGRPLSMEQPPLYPSDPVAIGFAPDIPRGSMLVFELVGGRSPAWLNVSTTWEAPRAGAANTSWRRTAKGRP